MARLLVVDDDARTRHIVRKRLVDAGHEVTEAVDAESALECFRDGAVDVVITDIVLPGMSGHELIVEIHQADPTARVVAISGAFDQGVPRLLREAEARGALRTLAKPFNTVQLLDAVQAVLNPAASMEGEN